MTNGLPTLLDLAKVDAGDAYPLIEESVQIAPELGLFPADIINGTTMELTVRTDLPTVGFRHANEGAPRSKSKFETRVFQTFLLDAQIAVDEPALLRQRSPGRYMQAERLGHMEAAMRHVSRQIYYGVGNDEKGFPGLRAQASSATTHVVDADGSTALTSVWMVRLGVATLEILTGNGRTIYLDEEWRKETIYDAAKNPIPGLVNWMHGALGLRLANKNAAVRIKKLGTDSGKGLTDTLLYQAYEKFTEFGAEPTHILMNGRSREQLRSSRTNTGSNERGEVPPLPSDWNGIPIVRTAGLLNNETA
jgi:hypothetical protein